MPRIAVREATAADLEARARLGRLSPEEGALHLRYAPRPGTPGVEARHPGARAFVATAPGGEAVVGTVSVQVAPTQVNGMVVPGAYLFGLRVHPAWRRRGVAGRLIAHAVERARAEHGARAVWAAIIQSNLASLSVFRRAGFTRLRDLRAKAMFAVPGLPRHRVAATIRPAQLGDLPVLAQLLNGLYAEHNFWRPLRPVDLTRELLLPLHAWEDTLVVEGGEGRILAAAGAQHVSRLAEVRIVGLRGLPRAVNRLLSPLLSAVPIRPALLRFCALPPGLMAEGVAVVGAHLSRRGYGLAPLLATADPRDEVWRTLGRLPGLDGAVHLVASSDEPIDETRPAYLQ